MSYKCFVCHAVSPPGHPRLTHVVTRLVPGLSAFDYIKGRWGDPPMREEIARELPVCRACQVELDAGIPLAVLLEQRRPLVVVPAPIKRLLAAPAPRPEPLPDPIEEPLVAPPDDQPVDW